MEFVDFKKAYDTVNRNILWSVLFHNSIQGKMLRNLKAMYRSVQACDMSKSEVSGYFECFQGLKQWCVASPVLFSLLINELVNEIIGKAKHGIPLGPTEIELFIFLRMT